MRLQDAVNGMNEEARWGRIDLAQGKVDERYKSTFLTHRKQWHKSFQPADLEVQRIDMKDDGAVSEVVLSGYDMASMELISATVRQNWKKDSGKFYLINEEIIDGSRSIFTEMPKKATPQQPSTAVTEPQQAAKATVDPQSP